MKFFASRAEGVERRHRFPAWSGPARPLYAPVFETAVASYAPATVANWARCARPAPSF